MKYLKHILCIFFLVFATIAIAQQSRTEKVPFTVKGEVIEDETNKPIAKVNVEIVGGEYTTTDDLGRFSILAKEGDQIVISSDDFQTVYYDVEEDDFIKIRVEAPENEISKFKKVASNRDAKSAFTSYIDSAKITLKKNATQSIGYVTTALEVVPKKEITNTENSIAFETLGDINLFWKQSDLAIGNYKRSLTFSPRVDVQIKLADAYRQNNKYQESIELYTVLLKERLSNYQKVIVYEGLGDNYKQTNVPVKSIFNYQKALDLATANKITPKITDLNSKIGEAYALGGSLVEAEEYFGNSLTLSKKENRKRSVEEKNKVADFYNQKKDYNKEIELRSEALEEINYLEDDDEEPLDNNSPLTPQRQNYKIANAFLGLEKYDEAIPFLEKSINEAESKSDLVVEKDATRKLSEVYRDIGDFDKATESYERYVEVIDELYVKKEQEISQASRLSRDIALQQNRISSLESEREINESRYKLAFENQELIEKNNTIQKWIIGSLVLIALLLLAMAYNQYKGVRQQKYANNILALKSLRTQMNPHFIFNALNSVNSFIAQSDERAANKYLSEFSQLMRSVLENSEEDFIPLEKEIELLELYVKLEHFRFQDKFEYTIEVDNEIPLNEFVIPPMLLQPYVENAVWHGLRYKEEKGLLTIHFQKIDTETVQISIIDNGIGREKSKALKTENQKKQKSKGMGNIKKRIAILNEMYKDKVDVTVSDVFDTKEGTQVVLTLKKD
ncbi:tetratricopeptide repeat-containing sensor histidine kinase [Patiriisocius hiemis]|uniref:Histidine kinase n=1 Tax=Patiriisocius hiemis TaxID=3075604 RepID=A0ABU2YGH0_9FLAO|nr:histidine kinase [Constantimarinum sp. W242]MDT0556976.1 histidine kinase [Constantimarinum sp. W242]